MRSHYVARAVIMCAMLMGGADASAQFGAGTQSPKIEKPGEGKPFQTKRLGGLGVRGLENHRLPDGLRPTVLRPKTTRESALLIGLGLHFADAPRLLPASHSWVDWWEINRDRHVQTLIREALKVRERNGTDREEAVRVLTDALSRKATVAPSAAIALGRMGATEAVGDLIVVTQQKNPEPTNLAGWLALGLMGGEGRGKFLLAKLPTLDEVGTLGCITALGLMDEMPDGGAEALLKYIDPKQRVPEIRRMALWAINEHEAKKHRRLLYEILAGSREPYLVMEALEGLGKAGDVRDVETLVNYAGGGKSGKLVPFLGNALRAFEKTKDGNLGLQKMLGQVASNFSKRETYSKLMENIRAAAARALGQIDGPADRKRVAEGLGALDHPSIQQSFLMGEKAQFHFMLSLGLIGQRYAPQTLGAVVNGEPTGEGHSWDTGFASRFDRDRMDDLASRRRPRPLVPQNAIHSGLHRCYAAISSGLLVHRINELSGDARARNALESEAFGGRDLDTLRDELLDNLLGPLRSPGEYSYTRAACALGIGLSGDKRLIPHLVDVMGKLEKRDEAIFGYIALSLGMLGDKDLPLRLKGYLGPAKKALDVEGILKKGLKSEYTYEQRMSRRAAVMGLGALGDQAAAPLLIGEWGKDPWVSYEVARALGALKDRTISEDLSVLVYQRTNDLASEVAAWSLGDLYDAEYPSRLSRLQREYAGSKRVTANTKLKTWLTNSPKRDSDKGYAGMSNYMHRYGNPIVYRYLYPIAPRRSLLERQ